MPQASQATTDTVRSRQKERREADILSASIRVMAAKGYHQTRISDIAQEAGVAYGLVYHYFGSKEKILRAILENIWERFGQRIERITARNRSTVEKLSMISDYMLDTCIARPDIIQLLVQEIVRARNIENLPDMEIVRRIMGMIESIVAEGISEGELPPDSDSRLLALTLFGAVEMILSALVNGLYDSSRDMSPQKIRVLKRKMRVFISAGSFGRMPS